MALGLSGGFSSVFVRGVSSGRTTDNDFSFSPTQGDSRSYGLLSLARSALLGLAVWKRTGVCKIRALHSRYCTHNHIRNSRYFTLPQHSNLQSSWSVTILEKKLTLRYFVFLHYIPIWMNTRVFIRWLNSCIWEEWIRKFWEEIYWIVQFYLGNFLQEPPQISFINYSRVKKNHIPLKLS